MKYVLPLLVVTLGVSSGMASVAGAEPLTDTELTENFVGKTFYGTTTTNNCTYARYNAPDGKYHLALKCGGNNRDIRGTYTISDGELCSIFLRRGGMQRRCSQIERDGDGFKSPTSDIHRVVDGNPEGLKP